MIIILVIIARRTRCGSRGIDLSKYMDRVEEDTRPRDTDQPRTNDLHDWNKKVKWRK